jgi:regulator of CtrA degradation
MPAVGRASVASPRTARLVDPPAETRIVASHPTRREHPRKEPLSFGRAYAQSNTFRTLFREGMTLVEETADYLDGPGRRSARDLPRPASIVYATESMRLTTRLMQLASWLLLHRSVREGDMTPERAREEKKKIRLDPMAAEASGPGWDELPPDFRALVSRSLQLQKRVERIDVALLEEEAEAAPNPVSKQISDLAAALQARD